MALVRRLLIGTLVGLLATSPTLFSTDAGSQPTDDARFSVALEFSEIVFAGVLTKRHPSDCLMSGGATSRQGLTFKIREVLKGQSLIQPGKSIRVEYPISGGSLEVYRDKCHQLSPDIFRPGAEFIVSSRRGDLMLPIAKQVREWTVTGGPWPDVPETRAKVQKLIQEAASGMDKS